MWAGERRLRPSESMSMEENGAARKWIYVGTGLVNGTFLIWNSAKSL